MYIFTGEFAMNPLPDEMASGSRRTHLTSMADLTPVAADRVDVCRDWRISAFFGVRPSGSESSPTPDSFMKKSGPVTSSAVAARGAFGATVTSAGAPSIRYTDEPCGTPDAGILEFT